MTAWLQGRERLPIELSVPIDKRIDMLVLISQQEYTRIHAQGYQPSRTELENHATLEREIHDLQLLANQYPGSFVKVRV